MKTLSRFDVGLLRAERPLSVLFLLPGNPWHSTLRRFLPRVTSGMTTAHYLGVSYLSAAAKACGHRVSALYVDVNAPAAAVRARIAQAAKESRPDVVGLTCGLVNQAESLALARIAKEAAPEAFVVFGGPQPTAVPAPFLAAEGVDAVVRGEGELSFCALLQALAGGGSLDAVPGLLRRGARPTAANAPSELIGDLDSIPFPDLDVYGPELWRPAPIPGGRSVTLLSSRGCPYACAYCETGILWKRRYRRHSAARVVDEMDRAHAARGVMDFFFVDELFVFDPRPVRAFCAELRRRGRTYRWGCTARSDLVEPRLLGEMASSGCGFLALGVESGSQRLLDRLGKKLTLQDHRNAFRTAREAGLSASAFFMLGFPTETREEMERTVAFAGELKPFYARFSPVVPLQGTPLWKDALAHGRFVDFPSVSDLVASQRIWVPEGHSREDLELLLERAHETYSCEAFDAPL